MRYTLRGSSRQSHQMTQLDVRIRISGHSSHLRYRRTDSDHTLQMLDFMAGINFKNNFWHFQFASKRLDDVIPTYNTVLKRRNVWFVNKWRQLNFNISFPRCFLGTKSYDWTLIIPNPYLSSPLGYDVNYERPLFGGKVS